MLVEVKAGSARIVDDIFTTLADGEPLPDGPVIVSLKRFLAEKDGLLARAHPLGVRLETAESPELLGPELHRLAAVALHVHHFRDGRHFSWARLLRTRLDYRGEVRIGGHVLKDQIAFYARVGVNVFDLAQNIALRDIEAALSEISQVYQPSVDGRPTIQDLRAARAHGALVPPT